MTPMTVPITIRVSNINPPKRSLFAFLSCGLTCYPLGYILAVGVQRVQIFAHVGHAVLVNYPAPDTVMSTFCLPAA